MREGDRGAWVEWKSAFELGNSRTK